MDSITKTAQTWLTDFFDNDTKKEIKHLMEKNPEELKERFYKDLEFGTGGMRGVMGVGTNRINKYTLGKNIQGLSNYLKKCYKTKRGWLYKNNNCNLTSNIDNKQFRLVSYNVLAEKKVALLTM